jgi:hypothetical protein
MKKYLHTSKVVGPLLVLLAYLSMAFSMAPLGVLDSFSICSLVLFLIMIWVGIAYNDIDYDMAEQTIYIKLQKKYYIYLSKTILMVIISICFSFISMIFALIMNAKDHFKLFIRIVRIEDVSFSLFILILGAISGGIIGLILNKNIIKKRKMAVIIGGITGLIAITKNGINEKIPFMKIITWIFPPICDLCETFSKLEIITVQITVQKLLIPMIWLIIYIIIEVLVYIFLMLKIKYE